MARLHEHHGKSLLSRGGLAIPRGGPAASPDEAATIAANLAVHTVIKIQSFSTGRAAIGGVAFADSPQQAAEHARRMLAMSVGNFPITHVLVEEKLAIAAEMFVSFSISDRDRAPVILLAFGGGSGIEERAASVTRLPCDVHTGPDAAALAAAVNAMPLGADIKPKVIDAIRRVFAIAKANEARTVEINPLVVTTSGAVVAADCRVTIDDYAVFRHPDLNIEIARELDHPPTELERIAYRVEQEDHRGTFFFAQMNRVAPRVARRSAADSPSDSHSADSSSDSHSADSSSATLEETAAERRTTQTTQATQRNRGLIGFHGAGGGGSMMSMDAITNEGFTIANFCDTSGNPSPAKVYRAARIILSQPMLIGYFGSGSGVANQEQYWSAYGLAKAFWEMNLDIPAVIRLGGNTEDRAVDILQGACRAANLPATVEVYRKSDSPAQIAARFATLVAEHQHRATETRATTLAALGQGSAGWNPRPPRRPSFVGMNTAHSFPLKGGTLWIDPACWQHHAPAIIARANGLLKNLNNPHPTPTLTITPESFLSKDSDMIACEVECRRDGIDGVFVVLDIPGLDALRDPSRPSAAPINQPRA